MASMIPLTTRFFDVREQLDTDIAALCEAAGVERYPTPRIGANVESRMQMLALREQVADLTAALRVLLADRGDVLVGAIATPPARKGKGGEPAAA